MRSTASIPPRQTQDFSTKKKRDVFEMDDTDGIDVTNILPGDQKRRSKVEAMQKNRSQTLNELKSKRKMEDERVEGMSRKRNSNEDLKRKRVAENDNIEATSSRRTKISRIEEEEEEDEVVVNGIDNEDSGEEFRVEKIIAKKEKNGKIKYKIRWENSGPDDDEWVSVEDCSCDDKIAEFESTLRAHNQVKRNMVALDEEDTEEEDDDHFSFLKKKRKTIIDEYSEDSEDSEDYTSSSE
jgi:hypothetical protein